MDELEFYNRHYIAVDGENRVTDGFSDAFRRPDKENVCINERGGYQFRLFPQGEENPRLLDEYGIPLYKWDSSTVIHRTEEEIEADRAELPEPEEPSGDGSVWDELDTAYREGVDGV